MSVGPWRILIVEDHQMAREGLANLLNRQVDLSVCGQADRVEAALAAIEELRPDLVIVDLSLVDSDGLSLVRAIRQSSLGLKAIVFSSRPAWMMAERALRAGAQGYLRKSTNDAQILDAVSTVMAGKTYTSEGGTVVAEAEHPLLDSVGELSDLEYQVFDLLGHGMEAAEIAEKMGCSVNTVRTKMERMREKFGMSSTPKLRRAAIAWRMDTLL